MVFLTYFPHFLVLHLLCLFCPSGRAENSTQNGLAPILCKIFITFILLDQFTLSIIKPILHGSLPIAHIHVCTHFRIMGQNIYSKLPEKASDEIPAEPPETEPLYSTVTNTLLPTQASPLYESITSVQASARQKAAQTQHTMQKPTERDTAQPEDSQAPIYSTIVRQEDGKKVTTTIVDLPRRNQNRTAPSTEAASNQPSTDAPKTGDTMSTDGDPSEDNLYSTVMRVDGKKVTVKSPVPKKRD